MQLIPVTMFVMVATEAVATSHAASSLRNAPVRGVERSPAATPSPLPQLPLVPGRSQLLGLRDEWPSWLPALQTWRIELTHAPLRHLGVRDVYTTLAKLPRLDRVGRFAHIDFPMSGLSAGPELLRLSLHAPREDYPKAQELTPGCGVWYKPAGDPWAVGIVTGTRLLIAQQSSAVVDPFTSEARWAFFLP